MRSDRSDRWRHGEEGGGRQTERGCETATEPWRCGEAPPPVPATRRLRRVRHSASSRCCCCCGSGCCCDCCGKCGGGGSGGGGRGGGGGGGGGGLTAGDVAAPDMGSDAGAHAGEKGKKVITATILKGSVKESRHIRMSKLPCYPALQRVCHFLSFARTSNGRGCPGGAACLLLLLQLRSP